MKKQPGLLSKILGVNMGDSRPVSDLMKRKSSLRKSGKKAKG